MYNIKVVIYKPYGNLKAKIYNFQTVIYEKETTVYIYKETTVCIYKTLYNVVSFTYCLATNLSKC